MAMVKVNGYLLSDTKACSPRQAEVIDDLLNQLALMDAEIATDWRQALREMYLARNFSQVIASQTMTQIGDTVRNYQAAEWNAEQELQRQQRERVPFVPSGRYAVTTDAGHTGFYRVRVADDGRVTMFVYASDNQHEVKPWATVLGILRKIDVDSPEVAAFRFAQETERCPRCYHRLTDPESIARGMGKECASK